ncbi:unnamed protein product [Nesidiocoris tenuis]|uniref:Uncharacterized protein n=1 Tax=Nesidiocoris tenuis TaxID=355587 RepID=A0A6H5GW69_9HEMI|nr:unnamed protein product [Nesidiocoris tenuis]
MQLAMVATERCVVRQVQVLTIQPHPVGAAAGLHAAGNGKASVFGDLVHRHLQPAGMVADGAIALKGGGTNHRDNREVPGIRIAGLVACRRRSARLRAGIRGYGTGRRCRQGRRTACQQAGQRQTGGHAAGGTARARPRTEAVIGRRDGRGNQRGSLLTHATRGVCSVPCASLAVRSRSRSHVRWRGRPGVSRQGACPAANAQRTQQAQGLACPHHPPAVMHLHEFPDRQAVQVTDEPRDHMTGLYQLQPQGAAVPQRSGLGQRHFLPVQRYQTHPHSGAGSGDGLPGRIPVKRKGQLRITAPDDRHRQRAGRQRHHGNHRAGRQTVVDRQHGIAEPKAGHHLGDTRRRRPVTHVACLHRRCQKQTGRQSQRQQQPGVRAVQAQPHGHRPPDHRPAGRDTAGHQVEHARPEQAAGNLGKDVPRHLRGRKTPGRPEPEGDRRVEVPAGQMPQGIGPGDHGQAEGQ